MGKKIVFLDRDGVINKLVEQNGRMVSPRRYKDFELLPCVPSAIRKSRRFEFGIIVVTNQPDISRGLMKVEELYRMHQLVRSLGVQKVKYCPHSDYDDCMCRKPKPGLLIEQIGASKTSLTEVWMIGDSTSDVLAGKAIGAQTVLICSNSNSLGAIPDLIANDLLGAVNIILKTTQNEF